MMLIPKADAPYERTLLFAKKLAKDMGDIVVDNGKCLIIYHDDEHDLPKKMLKKGERIIAYPNCNCKYCKELKQEKLGAD